MFPNVVVLAIRVVSALLLCALPVEVCAQVPQVNAGQQFVFAGLRTAAAQGRIHGAATDAAGDVYLAYDQGDGVRILKVANDGGALLGQVQLGAKGDAAVAIALDPSGNVYVVGTSTSNQLFATPGAAFGQAAANTSNAFVAKFDPGLKEVFLSFTGGTRIAASAVAASGDGVFVTGILYGTDLPVSDAGIEQTPAYGSFQNGFVEHLTADGTSVVYATYLTGADGDTTPTSIAVDALDDAYIVGSTSASGFATVNALVPVALSNPSGFLMRLTPAGDGISFATFVPGTGLDSVALDSSGQVLLVGGNVNPGQFPIDTISSPIVPGDYQVLLRMPLDGSAVLSGTLLATGTTSTVTATRDGGAWVAGAWITGTIPQLPFPALAGLGDAYAIRVTHTGAIDQAIRLGGIANQQQTYAAIPISITGLAVDQAGDLVAGGIVQPTASSSLLATETYDLPLTPSPTQAFPASVSDAEATAGSCQGSLCSGSAGFLAKYSFATAAPSLIFSTGDLPVVTLRNLGAEAAQSLSISVAGGAETNNCPATLEAGAECAVLVEGAQGGTLSASSGAAGTTFSFPALTAPTSIPVVVSPKELDFGLAIAGAAPTLRTLTLTNLSASDATIPAGLVALPRTVSPFTEAASDCTLGTDPGTKTLAAGVICHIQVAFSGGPPGADGFVSGEWQVGSRQVKLTGFRQTAALTVSSAEVAFGTVFEGTPSLPRYLYLSNHSGTPISHAALGLPSASPFSVGDGCPSVIGAGAVCRIQLDYKSRVVPSSDSTTLQLDHGLSVILTASTSPQPSAVGSTGSPAFTVFPQNATFGDAVVVTGVSSTTINVGIVNSGTTDLPVSLTLSGDFIQTNSCAGILPAGATCAVALQFSPSQPGLRQGLLSVASGAGTATAKVFLSGYGTPILVANNGTLALGDVPLGQPVVQFYKVSQPFDRLHLGTTGPYTVTLTEDTGFGHGLPAASQFVVAGTGTCRNCWLAVRFQPEAVGPQPGTLTISSVPAGTPYQLALTGAGLADSGLILTPTALDFGTIPVDSVSGTTSVMLVNTTRDTQTIQSIAAASPFSVVTGGISPCGNALMAGASCFIELVFAPSQTGVQNGVQNGQLTVQTSTGLQTASLTGTSVADPGVAITPLALDFENTGDASATIQSISLRNTGQTTLDVGTPVSGSASFTAASPCGPLPAGASCAITVTYLPGSQSVADTLFVPITTQTAGGSAHLVTYQIALAGAFTRSSNGLQVNPPSAAFGSAATNSLGATRQFTVGNTSPADLTLTVHLPQSYLPAGPPCSTVLRGGTCSFNVEFAPAINGDIAGTIKVDAVPADGSPALSTLAYAEGFGIGSGSLAISGGLIVDGVYSFGQASPGQPVAHTFTLKNLQSDPAAPPINIRRIVSAPPFLALNTCGSPLVSGATCDVTVSYAPGAGGASATTRDVGSLTIDSDSQSTPGLLYLSGQPAVAGSGGTTGPTASFAVDQGSLNFGSTALGDGSQPQSVSITNTGNQILHILSVQATPDFMVQSACGVLPVGSQCTVTVTSTPQTVGSHSAALTINSDATSDLEYVSLFSTGTQPALSITPSSLSFGPVVVGRSVALPLRIVNQAATPVTFLGIFATAGFATSGNCPASGGTLAPQASCTLQVVFAPTAAGLLSGSVSLTTSATTYPLTIPLTGQGLVPQVVVSPKAADFGTVAIGSTARLTITLTNASSSTVTGLSLQATGDFSVSAACSQTTLPPAATCQSQLAFTPTLTGQRTGSLSVASSDPASPAVVNLTGVGAAPPSFLLSVNGGAAATLTIVSGQFATFALQTAPTGGFTGNVALTCTPLSAVPYASCSLLPPLALLSGTVAASSTATINTLTSGTGVARLASPAWSLRDRTALAILCPGLFLLIRRRSTGLGRGAALSALLLAFFLVGCGGNSPNLHYTPPGTYQFTVSAVAPALPSVSQSVQLTVVVTPR